MIRAAVLPLILLPTAAIAQFHAQPQSRPVQERVIARDMLWQCGSGGCVAPDNHSRAAIVCARLAREVGPLVSFTVAGRAFTGAELENCNRSAR